MKRPVIGISCSIRYKEKRSFSAGYRIEYLNRPYFEAIEKNGGVPVPLPNFKNLKLVKDILSLVDGLLISGGNDVLPQFYSQKRKAKLIYPTLERDRFEIELIKQAYKRKLPILGICRGMQSINVAFGGNLWQDFSFNKNYTDHTEKHKILYLKKHKIRIEKKSLLHSIIKKEEIMVNTSHHQMVDRVPPSFKVSAWSVKDNVIEAIEHKGKKILGVQWHAELMKDLSGKKIFRWLIEKAKKK